MAKKIPEWIKKDYEEWKKVLWRAFRSFVSAFIVTFAVMLTSVTVENFQSKETLIKLVISVGMASVVAGIQALGKSLRDAFPESEIINKLPI